MQSFQRSLRFSNQYFCSTKNLHPKEKERRALQDICAIYLFRKQKQTQTPTNRVEHIRKCLQRNTLAKQLLVRTLRGTCLGRQHRKCTSTTPAVLKSIRNVLFWIRGLVTAAGVSHSPCFSMNLQHVSSTTGTRAWWRCKRASIVTSSSSRRADDVTVDSVTYAPLLLPLSDVESFPVWNIH